MLRLIAELGSLEEPAEFRSRILPGLRDLVPCETAAYNEINLDSGSIIALADPDDVIPPGGVDALTRLRHQNPLIVRCERTRDGRPYKWSDLISRRELHRTELYRELYEPMGIEYQMAFLLPSPIEQIIGLTVNRGSRDFAERDRTVLNLVRSPLIQVYRTVERYAHLAARLRALERGVEESGSGIVVMEDRQAATAEFISEEAGQALGLSDSGGPLPAPVREWLEEATAASGGSADVAPAVLADERGGRVVVRYLPARRGGDRDALLVERHESEDLLSTADLRAAGLTRRQAEVMRLIALGKTNQEIAAALVVSPRTIEKHLQNIYERLGASTRTEAVLAVWSIRRAAG
jgi:DNA-binding CsgD family transcriptional regulator